MSSEDSVRQASRQFYEALTRMANGDASAMGTVWSHGAEVTALHPIGGRAVGWEAIKASFEQVAEVASEGEIELQDQLIQVAGDVAFEVGAERGRVNLGPHAVTIDHRVTNIYRREEGAWRMIHHHTDVSSAMLDVLDRL